MKKFMEYNFDIESIVISCSITPATVSRVHMNRSNHGIVFHTGGIWYYTFNEKNTITILENDILYLPKDSNYTVTSVGNASGYVINFQLFNNISFEPFKLKIKNSKSFIGLFQNSEQVWRQKSSGFEMKCKSLLYNILFDLRKEHEIGYINKDTLALIKPAIDYIYTEYTMDNIEISYLAKLCNISEAYFRRIFLKRFGISPIKYINNLKIERAKELILSGLYSISEAATASGFHDDSYFSRKFKEATGVCPIEYKNAHLYPV